MIQADDAKIAVKLDSREAEAELERLRAALEGLDVQTEKEDNEKQEKDKQETETKYTLGGAIRNAYDIVVDVLETATMISPLIRGYVRQELASMLDATNLSPGMKAILESFWTVFGEPRMKGLEDEMIKWSSLIQSVIPAASQTADVWKAAALFGEGMSPSELVETFGLFMDLEQQNTMLHKDVARRTFEAYGGAWGKMAEQLGKEYSNDKLQATLEDMLEQSFYK